MERFFLELLNRAICAGWLVPVILILRVVFKKMPKWIRCLLWGMVAVRLLVPIQIESAVSLIPSVQTVSPDWIYAEKPEIHTGIGVLNTTVNPVISDYFAPVPENSVNPVQVLTTAAAWVWFVGVVFMLFYAALSYVCLRVRVRTAVPALAGRGAQPELVDEEEGRLPASAGAENTVPSERVSVGEEPLSELTGAGSATPAESTDGAEGSAHMSADAESAVLVEFAGMEQETCKTSASYQVQAGHRRIPVLESERVESPFVLGLIRPRIYLPTGVRGADRNYIISHEKAHIHRKDHWIKPFGYLLLAVYWFHPLLWAAYILLCRDIEYACDERVVKRYDVEARKAYSTALLSCSARRFRIAACPVAFGEVGVRQRVKGVLHYKKPAFWMLVAAAACCVVVAVCFLTNPKTGHQPEANAVEEGGGFSVSEANGEGTDSESGVSGGMNEGAAGSAPDLAVMAVPAEGAYGFDRCIYMNPLSSYFPVEGQQISGYLDADGLTWNEYGRLTRFSFEKTGMWTNADSVPWQMFESEELEALFRVSPDASEKEINALRALPAEKRLWRPLEDGYRLLYVDGELWLMRYSDEEIGVWSIYALRPQEKDALDEAIEAAVWEWAERTNAFGGVSKSGASAEGVTGELKATYPCVSYVVLATEGSVDAATGREETVTVYAHVLATAYLCENTGITELSGSYVPAAITFLVNEDGSYTLSEYWTPREGSYYVPDIRERFPGASADAALDGQRYIYALIQESYAEAISETGVVDTQYVVRGLFQKMMEDPEGLLDETARAAERMAAYPLTVRELSYYGESTLRYIYLRFMNGGESGLEGELMACVMNRLISEEIRLRMPLDDGQAYFDELCKAAQDAYKDLVDSQGGEEQAEAFMREHMPAQYLLLLMLGQRTFDVWEAETAESDRTVTDFESADRKYEYYLTKEELLADIEQGYLFRLDTAFSSPHVTEGCVYLAPYVREGNWLFYVHEDNVIDVEIAFSDLFCRESVFQGEEQICVEVISPEGKSVYRFEKTGEEIMEDTSVRERISVTPGEWSLRVSFAYVCGGTPAHLRIAAAYETPSGEDLDWLKEDRLTL